MNIGKAMQAIREEKNLNRREMASELCCTATALWKIEVGKAWPKKSTVERFCFVTKTPMARLWALALEPEDFAPIPSVQDVVNAMQESTLFSKEEIEEYAARLTRHRVSE